MHVFLELMRVVCGFLMDVWMLQIKGSLKPYQEEHVKEQKKVGRVCDMTEEPRQARAPKAVDEDLYKIPPELLRQKPKRVGTCFLLLFFSKVSCENFNFYLCKCVAHGLVLCYGLFCMFAPTIDLTI